jgi:hypothetical protein
LAHAFSDPAPPAIAVPGIAKWIVERQTERWRDPCGHSHSTRPADLDQLPQTPPPPKRIDAEFTTAKRSNRGAAGGESSPAMAPILGPVQTGGASMRRHPRLPMHELSALQDSSDRLG